MPIKMKRIAPGHYIYQGYSAKREADGVWTLTYPSGERDGCHSLRHARAAIACDLGG